MPDLLLWLYLTDAVLLINHEIDSAYWKEWELFRLPGGITGFLLLHLRNKAFAHSDADLFDVHLSLSEYNGSLVPTYMDYPLEYFTEEELKSFQNMVEKLLNSFGMFIKSIFDYYGNEAVEYLTE